MFGSKPGCGFKGWGASKSELTAKVKLTSKWKHHDLRRTCATGMTDRVGIDPWIVEIVLNHTSGWRGGLPGRYNKAKVEGLARKAWFRWDKHIAALAAHRQPGDRVVALAA